MSEKNPSVRQFELNNVQIYFIFPRSLLILCILSLHSRLNIPKKTLECGNFMDSRTV